MLHTALAVVVSALLAIPAFASDDPYTVWTQVEYPPNSGQVLFDILEQDSLGAFTVRGAGSAAVTVSFPLRPRQNPIPESSQWMEVIGVIEGASGDTHYTVSSTVLPWGDELAVTFLMQDLVAYDRLLLRHRIEQGSRGIMMEVAAPQMNPGGGFAQPNTTGDATICIVTQGSGSDPCIVTTVAKEGKPPAEKTYTIVDDAAPGSGQTEMAFLIMDNLASFSKTGPCVFSSGSGMDEPNNG